MPVRDELCRMSFVFIRVLVKLGHTCLLRERGWALLCIG